MSRVMYYLLFCSLLLHQGGTEATSQSVSTLSRNKPSTIPTKTETLLLFDASGTVHSLNRFTGQHLWSSSFGGALVSSYSHTSEQRRLVPLIGGGVVEIDFSTTNEDDDADISKSKNTNDNDEGPLVSLDYNHQNPYHTKRSFQQQINRLPFGISDMVKHSPLPMVTYVGNPGEQQRRKITNVLGQTNTTMFALNLRNGHVGSYICSDGTRVPAPAQQRTGNEESTWENDDNVLLWIGRTDSTLRAFDAKTDIEMWNISSSVVTPRPLGGMLNPEANINGGAMDQIIALPDHRVTYERNHTLLWTFPSSSGSSSSHSSNSSDSSDAQDSSSSDRLLNAPLTSAYIISRESDTAIPIRVRHYLKDNDKDTNDEEKMDNDNSKTSQQDNTDLVFIGSFHGINQRRENHENNKQDNSMHRMLYGLTQNEHGYNNSNRGSTEDWFHTETGVATQMQLNTHTTKLWPLRISNAPNTPSHSRFPTLPTPLSIIDNSNTDTSNSNLWFSSAFIIAILVSVIVFLTVVMVYVLFPTNTSKAFTKTDTNHKVNINTIPTDPNLALKQASTSTWIDYNDVLGTGSHGTVVYGGTYGERPVAVKRMLRHYYSIAKREISL